MRFPEEHAITKILTDQSENLLPPYSPYTDIVGFSIFNSLIETIKVHFFKNSKYTTNVPPMLLVSEDAGFNYPLTCIYILERQQTVLLCV